MYIADLHIHSHFAAACSPQLTIPNLALWSRYKGLDLLGTGDCLHPGWLQEINYHLQDRGDGILTLKQEDPSIKNAKFILTTEIACIYSDQGKLRRIHLLLFFPSMGVLKQFITKLETLNVKLASDGRPITGLSAYQITEIALSISPKIIIIPAHIWTPWFSLYGANSGYDFLAACFRDLTSSIYAIETGQSSDPLMNWQITDLDKVAIVSFSDPHSLPRLGREATFFNGHLSYDELRSDLINQNIDQTIEFHPEEGKYHFSGHRKCNIVATPDEYVAKGGLCPVCKKPLTPGVAQRVEELATRTIDELQIENINGLIKSKTLPNRPGYRMLVQLEEIIAESFGLGVQSKKVQAEYLRLVTTLDNEINILIHQPISLITMVAGPKIAEGIQRVRNGQLHIEPGFDNTYGKVTIWNEDLENETDARSQIKLFD